LAFAAAAFAFPLGAAAFAFADPLSAGAALLSCLYGQSIDEELALAFLSPSRKKVTEKMAALV